MPKRPAERMRKEKSAEIFYSSELKRWWRWAVAERSKSKCGQQALIRGTTASDTSRRQRLGCLRCRDERSFNRLDQLFRIKRFTQKSTRPERQRLLLCSGRKRGRHQP